MPEAKNWALAGSDNPCPLSVLEAVVLASGVGPGGVAGGLSGALPSVAPRIVGAGDPTGNACAPPPEPPPGAAESDRVCARAASSCRVGVFGSSVLRPGPGVGTGRGPHALLASAGIVAVMLGAVAPGGFIATCDPTTVCTPVGRAGRVALVAGDIAARLFRSRRLTSVPMSPASLRTVACP